MVVVGCSEGPAGGPETLYFATEYRGDFIYMEWPDLPLYSLDFLIFNLEAGWSIGNADRHLFKDTGKRVKVRPFERKAR